VSGCPMSPSLRYVLQLADPRGRSDRIEFIWAAAMLLAAQLAFALGLWITNASFVGWRGGIANLVFGWLAIAAISRRLHDLGRSGWWMLCGVLAWVVGAIAAAFAVALSAGPHALQTGTTGFWAIFAALMMPPLGFVLWLHLAEGKPAANRYGPVPTRACMAV
jgi:uncharacterized membrane protein YhaH (DUF805 family)